MYQKRAIIYTRISSNKQSNWSTEGQTNLINNWCQSNKVEIIDSFEDKGYSARTFDRPDFKRLNLFIEKHYRTVDHLVVFAFDRFSRDAGEALVAIKKLQKQYGIKVVSVTENITFDAHDPLSFFYSGLMLLKGEDEIIRNTVRINMGIYTAKKDQGRYLGVAPFGYRNSRDAHDKPIIIPNPETSHIVQFVFKSFLQNMPIKLIMTEARKMGYGVKGNSALQKMLKNPVYIGLIHVKAYRDNPEEWVEGVHEPLIDRVTFYEVQNRFAKPRKHVQITDDLPLRGVLKCHCGLHLTGAASRGKSGKYFLYYKCKIKGHNNISAIKAHQQFDEILEELSLPERTIAQIKAASKKDVQGRLVKNTESSKQKSRELDDLETKIKSIEEKWINNQIAYETYSRWYGDLSKQKYAVKAQLDMLGEKDQSIFTKYENEMQSLSTLRSVYHQAKTFKKQQLVRMVFDNRLHYINGTYRTPYLMKVFRSNPLINSGKSMIIYNEKGENDDVFPSGGAGGIRTLVQTWYSVRFLHA